MPLVKIQQMVSFRKFPTISVEFHHISQRVIIDTEVHMLKEDQMIDFVCVHTKMIHNKITNYMLHSTDYENLEVYQEQ